MPPRPRSSPKSKVKPRSGAKASKASTKSASRSAKDAGNRSFPEALAALMRARKITVPKGLVDAPPVAYAGQPASVVEQLEQLPDAEIRSFAAKIAGYAQRQADRARREWDSSPLIAELRRRRLAEPPAPTRPVGASVSLIKPLAEWSDKEIVKAAKDWSKLGSR